MGVAKNRRSGDDLGKWSGIVETIEGWIESGRWRSGQKIPGSGELCAALAVSAPTLRKSLSKLANAGLLEAVSGGWRVASHRRPGTLMVGLLRRCGPEGQIVGEADREMFFRRALELEGARRGIRIETWGITDEGALFRQTRPCHDDPWRLAQGLVVSMWGMEEPSVAIARAASARLPLAIWEEGPLSGSRPLLERCRWFQSAHSPAAGEIVARHLVDLGHRAIAWISPFHASSWSRRRLEGIERIARESLGRASVVPFVKTDRWDPAQFTPSMERILELVDPTLRLPSVPLRRRWDDFMEKGRTLLRDRQILDHIEDLFQAAWEDPSLTAWVCANDDIALLAATWLTQRGIEPGRDLSLVGFDNSLRAQEEGIASVDFLEHDLASGVLNFLLDPDRWKSNRTTFLRGSLVSRSSCARPPSRAD